MNALARSFAFDDHLVRVVAKANEPWFVAMDVCKSIGIKNSRDAIEKLDTDEKDEVALTDSIGRNQEFQIVSESGLYSLILRSRAAITPGTPAHRFRKWVTSEILPQLRKTGSFDVSAPKVIDRQRENQIRHWKLELAQAVMRLDEIGVDVQSLDLGTVRDFARGFIGKEPRA